MAAKVKWAKFSVVVEMTCFCVSYVSKRSGMWSSVCPHATARRPICNAVATLPTKSGSHFSVELNASQSLFSFRAATREVSLFSTLLLLSPRPLSSVTPLSSLSSSLFTVSMAKYCRHVKFSNLSAFARRQNPLAKKPQSLNTNRPTIHAGSCPVAAIPTPTELTKILSAAASKKEPKLLVWFHLLARYPSA